VIVLFETGITTATNRKGRKAKSGERGIAEEIEGEWVERHELNSFEKRTPSRFVAEPSKSLMDGI
jgi:hypothetical protein